MRTCGQGSQPSCVQHGYAVAPPATTTTRLLKHHKMQTFRRNHGSQSARCGPRVVLRSFLQLANAQAMHTCDLAPTPPFRHGTHATCNPHLTCGATACPARAAARSRAAHLPPGRGPWLPYEPVTDAGPRHAGAHAAGLLTIVIGRLSLIGTGVCTRAEALWRTNSPPSGTYCNAACCYGRWIRAPRLLHAACCMLHTANATARAALATDHKSCCMLHAVAKSP